MGKRAAAMAARFVCLGVERARERSRDGSEGGGSVVALKRPTQT
jgi:hypothetical protein